MVYSTSELTLRYVTVNLLLGSVYLGTSAATAPICPPTVLPTPKELA